jgi:Methylamine utilisation protein MauE
MTTGMFAGAVGALLAGTLLCAGAAKTAVPAHLGRALGGLLPAVGARAVPLVRVVAAAEIATAVALSVPAAREVGATAAAVLGAAFAIVGAIAAGRRTGSPCGCFGRAQGKPLGVRNVVFGLAVVAGAALLLTDPSGGWSGHEGLPALGAATVTLLLAGWLYRDMIRDLCRPVSRTRRTAEMRSAA